jgi:hypothetical protein
MRGLEDAMEAGDQIILETEKVGQEPRRGVIVDVHDRLVHVRWESGQESTIVPACGAVTVIAHTRPPSAH